MGKAFKRLEGPTDLISSAQGITNSYVDLGGEIVMEEFRYFGLWVDYTVGTSTNIEFRAIQKHGSDHADEFSSQIETVGASATLLEDDIKQFNVDASGKALVIFDTKGLAPYIQIQVKDAADGSGTIDTAVYTKSNG